MDFLEETIKVLVIDGPGRLGKVTDLGSGKSVLSDGLNTNLEKINFFIIFPRHELFFHNFSRWSTPEFLIVLCSELSRKSLQKITENYRKMTG